MDILEGIGEIQQRQRQPMPPASFVMAGDARHLVLTSSAVLANDLYLGDRLVTLSRGLLGIGSGPKPFRRSWEGSVDTKGKTIRIQRRPKLTENLRIWPRSSLKKPPVDEKVPHKRDTKIHNPVRKSTASAPTPLKTKEAFSYYKQGIWGFKQPFG